MKKLIFLLLLFPAGLFSQNWQLINPGNVYFYKTNGSDLINNTVKVDSVAQNANDTVFYLNPVIAFCDTCESNTVPCENPFGNTLYFQFIHPNFLQQKVHILKNGKWYFQDTASFVLFPSGYLGDTWLFDTANNISAQITEKVYSAVFDSVYDSVKTISLSNNQKILISKHFGIVEFPHLYGNDEHAVLAGVEGDTIAGISLYKFHDYFNFFIGDVFQYYRSYFWVDWNEVYYNTALIKYQIISKEESGDTLKYGISGIIRENQYPGNYYEDTLVFIDSANHITNQYLNTLIDYPVDCRWCLLNGDLFQVRLFYSNEEFTLLDTLSLVNFLPGQQELFANMFFPCDESPGFLGSPDESNRRTYTLGFGLSRFQVDGFEWGTDSLIIGYVRNGDTVGTVYDDDVLLYREHFTEVQKTHVNIYPNPAGKVLNVFFEATPDNQPIEINLINLQGQAVYRKKILLNRRSYAISTSSFQNGFYLLEIRFPGHIETQKVVIQNP